MPAKVLVPLVTSDCETDQECGATTAVKDRPTWITSYDDRTEHAVTDAAQDASRAQGAGIYEALCGTSFIAAAMDVGPRRRCGHCERYVRARAELRDFNQRSRAARSRSRRLTRLPARTGRHAA